MSITIQEFGNQLAIVIDGSKLIAYPVSPGMWLVGASSETPSGAAIWPFDPSTVTSEYRSVDRPNHDGIDFGISGGTPIPASLGGKVVTRVVNFGDTSWGNYVVVETVIGTDTLRLLYAHMQTEPAVQLNEIVIQGQTLGPVGTTGNSTGNHLHWETRVNGSLVNPRDFMETYG